MSKKRRTKKKVEKVALNKDGIPIYACLWCDVGDGSELLIVAKDDRYYTGCGSYDSLQDAADTIAETQTDWETFWKTSTGITVKQLIEQEK